MLRWLLALSFAVSAHAQPYPDKPLRLVVGFSAGGPTDLPARFLAADYRDMIEKTRCVAVSSTP